MLDDAQLLRQVLTTEDPARWRAAWRAFVCRYQRLIAHRIRMVLRLGGASAEVDDVIGDVWLALLERNMARLRRYDAARGTVSSFIAMIATRIAIDRLRRHRPTVELDSEHPAAECTAIEDSVRLALVQRAMGRLSERERAFALRLFYEEQPPAQVAADLGISVNTVYSRRHKLQKKLAQMIEEMA